MIALHTIWIDASLHVWGEICAQPERAEAAVTTQSPVTPAASEPRWPDDAFVAWPRAVDADRLRRRLGDVLDALLVSAGVEGTLTIRLPFRGDQPVGSDICVTSSGDGRDDGTVVRLRTCVVPVLEFASADAIDLLTAWPKTGTGELMMGPSFQFWSRVAEFVLELLARQRFVPAIHRVGDNEYCGYWRAILHDEDVARRVEQLIDALPPVCRAAGVSDEVRPADIVERFVRTTVDGLVRRCMEGDELTHVLLETTEESCTPQIRWLRSLVGETASIEGAGDDKRRVFETVSAWLSRVEPVVGARSFRTCLRLESPEGDGAEGESAVWRLVICLQRIDDTGDPADAEFILSSLDREPSILRRVNEDARAELRGDVAKAARYFTPLEGCVDPEGPLSCSLSLEEAYAFLRDAAPILESEGIGVVMPNWWHTSRPRVRMWLHLRPIETGGSAGASSLGLDALVGYDWRVAVGDDELSVDELTRLARSKAPLVNLRGRWTEIQAADAAAAAAFLRENQTGRMTLMEALRQCYRADDLATGVPVAGLRASGWIGRILDGSANDFLDTAPPPEVFRGTLRPYQLRGLSWLAFMARLGLGACLADDMGLGKTIQLIALLLHERADGPTPGPTLLVVPMSLVGNWQREIERFAPTLRVLVHHGLDRLTGTRFEAEVPGYDVVISTYGLIHRDLEHIACVEWYRVALDEAQNIKNPAAKQATAIRSLRSVNRVALTGTPIENRLSELWSIMDFLNPGFLGTATDFRRRFALPIERYHDDDRAERLRHLIRPFVLRRLKSDPSIEVDLPEKMEMRVYCNLTREQAALYEATVGEMLGQIDRAGGIQRRGLILATLVKLKQICNHPAHFLGDGSGLPSRSGKCERLTEMLEEALSEGDRALVFTQFREMGHLLARLLHETFGREILFLHGGTTRARRDALVDAFQLPASDHPILVLSLKAGGHGLNLTAATHVFHFDRWWNPAVEDQATDRAHRIGQFRRVQVHKFVCIGTLEERIDGLLEEKRALADNIVGAGEDWLTELSTDRLREIFSLSREAVAEI